MVNIIAENIDELISMIPSETAEHSAALRIKTDSGKAIEQAEKCSAYSLGFFGNVAKDMSIIRMRYKGTPIWQDKLHLLCAAIEKTTQDRVIENFKNKCGCKIK